MKSMTFVTLLGMVVLVGCSTSIKTTLETAQQECQQVRATIKNVQGEESVIIRCTWEEQQETW